MHALQAEKAKHVRVLRTEGLQSEEAERLLARAFVGRVATFGLEHATCRKAKENLLKVSGSVAVAAPVLCRRWGCCCQMGKAFVRTLVRFSVYHAARLCLCISVPTGV